MPKRNKYPDTPGLDSEIDELYKNIDSLTGKVVDELPNISAVPEGNRFFVKQDDSSYIEYRKINGVFMTARNAAGDIIHWIE